MCHNEIRDLTAEWLAKTGSYVKISLLIMNPHYSPLATGGGVVPATANKQDMKLELTYIHVDSGTAGKVPFLRFSY